MLMSIRLVMMARARFQRDALHLIKSTVTVYDGIVGSSLVQRNAQVLPSCCSSPSNTFISQFRFRSTPKRKLPKIISWETGYHGVPNDFACSLTSFINLTILHNDLHFV
jgi:hypothetical protein